jgi:hypothetical protein
MNSLLQDPDDGKHRMEQILKLDANALLLTIRDLEHKLSNHQRYDKPPPWYTSLEQRLEQIEKWQQSFPGLDAANNMSPHRDGLSSNEASSIQNQANDQFLEHKIMSKLKNELAMKVENISLQFHDQVLNTNLEMDRLHKLLIIRPTTSELQQIVLSVQTMEENTSKQIQSVYHTLQSKIKDSISNEMVQLLTDLKTHQNHSNEKMEVISKLINNYSLELAEIQKNEHTTFQLLEQSMKQNRTEALRSVEELTDKIPAIISKEIEDRLTASQSSTQEIFDSEMKNVSESMISERVNNQRQLSALEERVLEELNKTKNELKETSDSLTTTTSSLNNLETEVSLIKSTQRSDREESNKQLVRIEEALSIQSNSLQDSQVAIKDLQSLDLFIRLPRAEESLSRLAVEVSHIANDLKNTRENEIRPLAERTLSLEEQVNVVLPRLIQTESIRVNGLIKDFDQLNGTMAVLANRLNDSEELINSLLPLQQKTKLLSEKCDKLESEVLSCKSLVENSIDANSEIIRRIEDMEEKFESLDDIINTRMNAIRDTLMETLLEKQYETTSMMRNVKDNLEVLSMTGEVTPAPVHSHGHGSPVPSNTMAKLSRMSSSTGKNFVGSDEPSAPALSKTGQAGVSAVTAGIKKQSSYRRPTISGAMITGNSLNNNINNSNNVNNNYPSSVMSDSFSTGPPTPRTFSNDDHSVGGGARKLSNNNNSSSHPLGGGGGGAGERLVSRAVNRLPRLVSEKSGFEDSYSHSLAASSDDQGFGHHGHGINLGPVSEMGPGGGPEQTPAFDDEVFSHYIDPNSPTAASPGGGFGRSHPFPQSDLDLAHSSSHHQQQHMGDPSLDNIHHNNNPVLSGPVTANTTGKPAVGKAGVAGKKNNNQKKHHPHQQQHQHHSASHLSSSSASALPGLGMTGLPQNLPLTNLGNSTSLTTIQNRSDVLTVDYSRILQAPGDGAGGNFSYVAESQFLADLCVNYEEISVKKKRVSSFPPILCHSLIDVTQKLAEGIANSSDFEMVEMILSKIIDENVHNLADIQYDETFVITRRQQKLAQCLESIQRFVIIFYQNTHPSSMSSSGGAVRGEARNVFLMMTKKALELFLTKHNQVSLFISGLLLFVLLISFLGFLTVLFLSTLLSQILVVGNSRLGRLKIPTCIACDRPLIEKVRVNSLLIVFHL